jgi:hypothetical protein
MPQPLKLIQLIPLAGKSREAVATGNNAAWMCQCSKRTLPLVGRTGSVKGASENFRVECPECGRAYFVVPDGYDLGPALEVRELDPKAIRHS